MSRLRVLISGASIAGPALAYWLVRAGCSVTIVERAPTLRTAGQGIDIRDAARDVVSRMGIWDRVLDKSSHEQGLEFINGSDRCFARWAADGSSRSFSNDIEILRGELAGILYDVTKDDVSYIFGDSVESFAETDSEVHVRFSNGTPPASFDLLVAADGLGSKIRAMALGGDSSPVRNMDSYVSYFSIPSSDADTKWSKIRWFERGRNALLRPDNIGRTRAFLLIAAHDRSDERLARLDAVSKDGIPAQKALFQELFQDAGWEVPRTLKGMHAADDFYMQHVAQIRLPRWSTRRVTVVGDAGYCPSPFAGGGTTLAFIGAYVLAGEISRLPHDVPAALAAYERVARPVVDNTQNLPPGIPWIVLPQSALGVRVLETFIWAFRAAAHVGLITLFSRIPSLFPAADEWKLPDYEAFK